MRDRAVQHRPAPYDRFAGRHQKAHAHHPQVVFDDRLQPIVLQMRPLVHTQQVGNAGAVHVGIHQADFAPGTQEPERQRGGDRALADSSLARADRHDALCRQAENPYWLGNAGPKIAEVLATVPLDQRIIRKRMTLNGEMLNGWYR